MRKNVSAGSLVDDSSIFYFEKGIAEKNAGRFLPASLSFEKAISFNQSFTEAYIENALVYK
ncbi:MAG: hypothetical protein ACKVOM_07960 [Ferruginibacter sp.]